MFYQTRRTLSRAVSGVNVDHTSPVGAGDIKLQLGGAQGEGQQKTHKEGKSREG